MRRSIRVGNLRGVGVYVHGLFLLPVLWAAWAGWSRYGTPGGVVYGVVTVVLLFACVLVHEVAHVQQALAAGIPVRHITLLPVGGMAELLVAPDTPKTELKIAGAGPLASVGLGLGFSGMALLGLGSETSDFRSVVELALSPTLLGMLVYLALANLALGAFNLLPAFPLDGGRLFRSLLALLLPAGTATHSTAAVGRLLAVGLGALAVAGLPNVGLGSSTGLVLTAVLIYVGSNSEAALASQRERLAGVSLERALKLRRKTIWTLSPADALTGVMESGVFDLQPIIPVVVGDRLVGLITQLDGARALDRAGVRTVAHAMRTRFPCLVTSDTLWEARLLLAGSGLWAAPVVERGRLRGLLTRLEVQAARRNTDRPASDLQWPRIIPVGRKRTYS